MRGVARRVGRIPIELASETRGTADGVSDAISGGLRLSRPLHHRPPGPLAPWYRPLVLAQHVHGTCTRGTCTCGCTCGGPLVPRARSRALELNSIKELHAPRGFVASCGHYRRDSRRSEVPCTHSHIHTAVGLGHRREATSRAPRTDGPACAIVPCVAHPSTHHNPTAHGGADTPGDVLGGSMLRVGPPEGPDGRTAD